MSRIPKTASHRIGLFIPLQYLCFRLINIFISTIYTFTLMFLAKVSLFVAHQDFFLFSSFQFAWCPLEVNVLWSRKLFQPRVRPQYQAICVRNSGGNYISHLPFLSTICKVYRQCMKGPIIRPTLVRTPQRFQTWSGHYNVKIFSDERVDSCAGFRPYQTVKCTNWLIYLRQLVLRERIHKDWIEPTEIPC
jgi:hypothetical protein